VVFRATCLKEALKKNTMDDEASEVVVAKSIMKMVSSQSSTKGKDQVTVHSLVLWLTKKDAQGNYMFEGRPTFLMVSRYVERSVSAKLAKETLKKLKKARSKLAPLSGAEGYAGAMFEVYAIRRLQAGDSFSL
jgi:hypothetical protein